MNKHTLKILEFERIKEHLKSLSFTEGGREFIENLEPSNRLETVSNLQDETTQAKEFIQIAGNIPLSEIKPIKDILSDSAIGVTVTSRQALDLYLTLKASREIKALISSHMELAPSLWAIAERIKPKANLERMITKAIDEDGEMLDSASEMLTSIMSQTKIVKNRVKAKLDDIIKTSSYSKMIQDAVITIRDDRYVIPIKSEFKNHFPCIVHDSSSSGQTLYVEPLSVIPLNNDLRNLRQRAREEIERILKEITLEIAYAAHDLKIMNDSVSKLDFIFSKGQLSIDWNCICPELDSSPKLKIISGRHPLLSVEPVPIDIQLGDGYRALVLTGPNTGGKTVSLKTTALFIVMTECGLHVPSLPGTKIGMFDDILVDIGDEQSISQNLSTFSSHMSNIVSILMSATKYTLVMLDELGAGTDPSEGAVLGYSILKHLYDNSVPTIITAHIGELKAFAYKHSHAMNASVGFDSDTLKPTFKIQIGTPGASHAFDICRRLGLPETILENAKDLLTDEQKDTTKILTQMSKDAKDIEEDRESTKRTKEEIEQLKSKHLQEMEDFENKKSSMLESELKKASSFLGKKMAEADEIVKKLAAATRQSKETDDLRNRIQEIRAEVSEKEPEIAGYGEPPDIYTLKPGDAVFVPRFKSQGIVMDVLREKNKVMVQVGSARIQVSADSIELAKEKPSVEQNSESEKRPAFSKVPIKLELYGLKVVDAIVKLEHYLDQAYGAGIPFVYIVHGRGTGTLRKSITEFLPTSPRVDRFHLADESEGGDAVTIVFLK